MEGVWVGLPTECSKEVQASKHKENNWFLLSLQCLLCSWWLIEIRGLLNQRRFGLVTREEPCSRKDCGALEEIAKGTLQEHVSNRHISDDHVLARGESCLGAGCCPGQSPALLSSPAFSYFCERNMNWETIELEDWSHCPALKRCQRTGRKKDWIWLYLTSWNELENMLRFPNYICILS